MRFVKFVLVALSAGFVLAAAQLVPAQQAITYVSCVKCHALPVQQAQGALGPHMLSYPAQTACGVCHDITFHEADPGAPPPAPYFWSGPPSGPGSFMTNICLSCHTTYDPAANHPNDVFPYFGATPLPPPAPTSVLPLFDPAGMQNQVPFVGGLVCSTCHDPHNPSYVSSFKPQFLRAGRANDYTALCGTCHRAEATPPTSGWDLFVPSRSTSVAFEQLPPNVLKITVAVKNRGNVSSPPTSIPVTWVDGVGVSRPIGSLALSSIPQDQEQSSVLLWTTSPDWAPGVGRYLLSFPPSSFLPEQAVQFVRAMNVTPAPTNVEVVYADFSQIVLAWDPPVNPTTTFEVYRDGMLIEEVPDAWFADFDLTPETPHVYTVKALAADRTPSQPSSPVGGTTTVAWQVIRVPEDHPTIQEAIDFASPGTSIHVAPGTYTEPFGTYGKTGIVIKGQDANACVLDFSAYPGMPLNIQGAGYYGMPSGNTLSGFTIKEAQVRMGQGDVLTGSVLKFSTYPAVAGMGGLLANNFFFGTSAPAVVLDPGGFVAAVNSIFYGPMPIYHSGPPAAAAALYNNDFVSWLGWSAYPGSGNFSLAPTFDAPGAPPNGYYTAVASPTSSRGLWFGGAFFGPAPDVGVFEAGMYYTPRPPSALAATYVAGTPGYIRLTWSASPDLGPRVLGYRIYRSLDPSFPPGTETPYATATPVTTTTFFDPAIVPGTMYYYRVRAFVGPAGTPANTELRSAPTNTASAGNINHDPVAVSDFAQTPEDQAATIAVLANDVDPDGDVLSVMSVGPAGHGVATVNPDRTVRYVPAANYAGPDSFWYTATDGRSGVATAMVTVDVLPVNDAPTPVNDTYSVAEDTVLHVFAPGILGNDIDPDGDPLQPVGSSAPLHGTLQYILHDGSFVYTPDPNFSGTDSFTYYVYDGTVFSANATVTITVTPVNDPPVATGGSVTTAEDAAVAVTLAATDPDGDDLFYELIPGPLHGTLTGTAPNMTYTPAPNYTGPDSFTFRAHDATTASAPATVTITVRNVNDAPVLAPVASQTVAEQATLRIPLSATDVDSMDTVALTAAGLPGFCSTAWYPDRTGWIDCAPGYADSGSYAVTVTVTDNGTPVLADAKSFTLVVTNTNRAPQAVVDAYSVGEDGTLSLPAPGVLGNDADPDGDALTAALVTDVSHGTLSLGADGAITYTPARDFNGVDSFTYKTRDGSLDSAPATVTITVTPVNDPPVANAGPDKSVKNGTTTTFNGSGSTDVDGTIVSYSWNFGDGTTASGVSATKKYRKAGVYTVTLTVTDNLGAKGTDTAKVTVTK